MDPSRRICNATLNNVTNFIFTFPNIVWYAVLVLPGVEIFIQIAIIEFV